MTAQNPRRIIAYLMTLIILSIFFLNAIYLQVKSCTKPTETDSSESVSLQQLLQKITGLEGQSQKLAPVPKVKCSTRYVFVDLGANRADSLRVFLKQNHTKFEYDFPRPEGCEYSDAEIHLFEANPVFNKDLIKAKEEFTRPIVFDSSAPENQNRTFVDKLEIYPMTIVYTKDQVIPFYLDTVNPENDYWGSSVLDSTIDVKRSGKVSVDLAAVDIAKFLMRNFSPRDFVVVKMDIEGAEYDIVPHMAKYGASSVIDYLLVEWHSIQLDDKVRDQKVKEGDEAKEILMREGVKMPLYDSGA
jgi:hypothetical protein